jgi:hypothetical protein
MTEDRPLYRDIAKVADLLSTGELLRAVQAKVGILG